VLSPERGGDYSLEADDAEVEGEGATDKVIKAVPRSVFVFLHAGPAWSPIVLRESLTGTEAGRINRTFLQAQCHSSNRRGPRTGAA
jgi:hypothetical protein